MISEKIDNLKNKRFLNLFIIALRVVLGLAFVYSSLPKILNKHFTSPAAGESVWQFFTALEKLTLYWQFLGWAQLICGLLLITQRFAALGEIMFIAIIANIFVITISLNMFGTPVVTFLMLLAGILLLVWDYKKFLPLFSTMMK